MDTTVLADLLDDGIAVPSRTHVAPGGDEDGDRTEGRHRPANSPEPSGLVAIQIVSMGGPSDPVLADLMEKAFEAADRNPNNLRNDPERRREAAEGFHRLMEEWQAENGAFTEEQLRRGRAILGRP